MVFNLNTLTISSCKRKSTNTLKSTLKTVKELVLKIRGSLKYAYARGLISNDFGHLLKSKGQEQPKSITEFKNSDNTA